MSDNRALKAALLVSATTLTSPHLLDYELVLLAPALAFLIVVIKDDGARDLDKSLMALIWITPLLARCVAGLVGHPARPVRDPRSARADPATPAAPRRHITSTLASVT